MSSSCHLKIEREMCCKIEDETERERERERDRKREKERDGGILITNGYEQNISDYLLAEIFLKIRFFELFVVKINQREE
jgi:hypothetical protein